VYERHKALRKKFDRIVEQYNRTQDPAKRLELLKQASEILDESNNLVMLAQRQADSMCHILASLSSDEYLHRSLIRREPDLPAHFHFNRSPHAQNRR